MNKDTTPHKAQKRHDDAPSYNDRQHSSHIAIGDAIATNKVTIKVHSSATNKNNKTSLKKQTNETSIIDEVTGKSGIVKNAGQAKQKSSRSDGQPSIKTCSNQSSGTPTKHTVGQTSSRSSSQTERRPHGTRSDVRKPPSHSYDPKKMDEIKQAVDQDATNFLNVTATMGTVHNPWMSHDPVPRKKNAVQNTEDPVDYKELKAKNLPFQIDFKQPTHPVAEDEDFTNDPHPTLETPLLYFIIRRSPKLLSAIQHFYNFRWDLTYPLQNLIPCTNVVRKAKIILTWSEPLLLFPFFIIMLMATIYSTLYSSISITGHVARTPLIFAYISAMKNNFLTFFLGMPSERAIKYHKLAARLAYLNGLLHTFVAFRNPATEEENESNFFKFLFLDKVNAGGTMLVLVLTCMIITSLPYVRRKFFELFYLVHIVCAVLALVCAFFHTGLLLPAFAILTWGVDLAVRKIYMPFYRYPRHATLKRISKTVVELSFPKEDGFDFNPGQYIYIALPQLGYLEWHPFSLSSSPKQKIVTLHIRKAGSWTKLLYSLAKKQSHVDILIDGPYGSIGVDLANPYRYQAVMLFSGGIGVTPMQSLCNSLMYEHHHGLRRLQKLTFVWIERDPVIMPEVDVVRRESVHCLESRVRVEDVEQEFDDISVLTHLGLPGSLDDTGIATLAAQLLAVVPPGRDSDHQLILSYPSAELDIIEELAQNDDIVNDAPHVKPNLQQTPPMKKTNFITGKRRGSWHAGDELSIDQSFLDQAFDRKDSITYPLNLQVYLTQKEVSRSMQRAMPPFVSIGRPDIQNLFREARREALQHHQRRVAVCVCAPLRIVNLCRKACAKYSDRYVTFDFHFEVFE